MGTGAVLFDVWFLPRREWSRDVEEERRRRRRRKGGEYQTCWPSTSSSVRLEAADLQIRRHAGKKTLYLSLLMCFSAFPVEIQTCSFLVSVKFCQIERKKKPWTRTLPSFHLSMCVCVCVLACVCVDITRPRGAGTGNTPDSFSVWSSCLTQAKKTLSPRTSRHAHLHVCIDLCVLIHSGVRRQFTLEPRMFFLWPRILISLFNTF